MTAIAESPRKIEFDMSPPTWPEPKRKFIPPSLRGRRMFSYGGRSVQEDPTDFGLYWIRMLRSAVGVQLGQLLNVGDVVQVPGNYAIQYVEAEQAEFVRDAKVDEEVAFLESARKKGYKVQGPPVRLADRPEYQDLLKKKKQPWNVFAKE